jgi:hypothetical protein
MLVLTFLLLIALFFQAIQQENAADLQLESQEIQDAVQRLYVYWAGYLLVRQTPARFSVNSDETVRWRFVSSEPERKNFCSARRLQLFTTEVRQFFLLFLLVRQHTL